MSVKTRGSVRSSPVERPTITEVKERPVRTDLEALDRHVIAPEEYEDSPEWTREMFETADLKIGDKIIRRGRPPKVKKKVAISIRLSEDVLEAFKRCGPGWQTRIDEALEQFLEEHPESAPVTAPAPSVPDGSKRSSPRPRRAR
jgi:uncharacterized protein (DUF4415 family)